MMRSIVLHIHEDDCLEARFQAALDLGRQFEGHLTCIQAIPYEFAVPGDFYGSMAAQMADEFRKEARRVREKYEARLAKEDVPYEWYDSAGAATRLISQHAPLSDVVILGAHNPISSPDKPSTLVTDVIGEVRSPIMVVPAALKSFDISGPAAIAWNDSAEAAHAVQGAMPLLRHASEVHILTVHEKKDKQSFGLPPTSAATYLARHGIEAEIVEIHEEADDALSIAGKLMRAASMRKAQYLVMGAYGHSRLRERILGGVTRDMLMDPALPLVLGH